MTGFARRAVAVVFVAGLIVSACAGSDDEPAAIRDQLAATLGDYYALVARGDGRVQLSVLSAHSSSSLHARPVPLKPGLQVQTTLGPPRSSHMASGEQGLAVTQRSVTTHVPALAV